MKCVKCGRDVDANALRCPWCEGNDNSRNSDSQSRSENDQLRCPCCGSTHIVATRKGYDPGCGCLGLLLFSWIGLLLGFLGSGEVEMVCGQCGAKWPAGKPHKAKDSGIGCLVLFIIFIIVLVIANAVK